MNALSQILNIIDYRTWKDVREMLNAIEEMKYVLVRLDSANTEAEFTTMMEELTCDGWSDSMIHSNISSLWGYQYNNDKAGMIEEVKGWITNYFDQIVREIGMPKLDDFTAAYNWYLNNQSAELSGQPSFKVSRIVEKSFDSSETVEPEDIDVVKQRFAETINCQHILNEDETVTKLRVFIIKQRTNGTVAISSGMFDAKSGYANAKTNELFCTTLIDAESCFDELRELVRISTSTKYEERQVIDLAYGNLSHPNIQFTLEDD